MSGSAQVSEAVDMRAILQRLTDFAGPPEAFLEALLACQCQLVGAQGGAILRLDDHHRRARLLAAHPAIDPDQPVPAWLAQAWNWIQAHHDDAADEAVICPVAGAGGFDEDSASPRHLIVLPLRGGGGMRGVAVFAMPQADEATLARSRRELQMSLSLLTLHELRLTLRQRQADLEALAWAVEVLNATNDQMRFAPAAMALCNELATRWGCQRVSLGLLRGRYVKLAAMSQTERINRRMKLVQAIELAMEECLDQDLEVMHPADESSVHVSRAAGELSRQFGPAAVLSMPLRRGDQVLGAVTLERAPDQPFTGREVQLLRLTLEMTAPRLLELHERDRWVGARAAAAARKGLAAMLGPQHTWAKAGAVAALVAVGLALLPGAYRVEAPFIVQTVQRQVIAAPFAGYLAGVEVEPGDAVQAGATVLAQLDTTALQLELAAQRASEQGALKEASLRLSEGKVVERDIALAEARAARAQARLLEHRIAQARIISPISGVVIAGDLRQQVGARVSEGEMLFEVAPLDALRAELHVPDDRVSEVRVGQQGELAPAMNPDRTIAFEVEHIHPMAQVINQRNVFRVRVKLLEPPDGLRPGVEGLAKIDVGQRPYAWIWTHRAVNWLRMKLWW